MRKRLTMDESVAKGYIITIDGPSGAGKSTVARMLARALDYLYLDSGAMYRAVAVAHLSRGTTEDMAALLKNADLCFYFRGEAKVFLDGVDVSEDIRRPEISLLASRLSQERTVREYLTAKQREMGKDGGIVIEGRDAGSVVFPHAHFKFYLDAKAEERARRRYLELKGKGVTTDPATVLREMEMRDRDDSEREIAPLLVPEGAISIDTSGLDTDGVVKLLLRYVREYGD